MTAEIFITCKLDIHYAPDMAETHKNSCSCSLKCVAYLSGDIFRQMETIRLIGTESDVIMKRTGGAKSVNQLSNVRLFLLSLVICINVCVRKKHYRMWSLHAIGWNWLLNHCNLWNIEYILTVVLNTILFLFMFLSFCS